MKKSILRLLGLFVLTFSYFVLASQTKTADSFAASNFSGLKYRNIGPGFMSGRIADIAIHPDNQNIWYVAVGSGGVWKTLNSGTTWTPIFDDQSSYSIGCVSIDPNNHETIWVGTGENVGGRHVGYGDGVYKSTDGGKTWKNMGLKESQHISKIIIHPDNSQVIWVAAQGPLWNKGGERGLYKSTNGGNTWKQVLGDNEWVGVTDLVMDPTNPQRLYAATWQRHRNVASYMANGPGTAIYTSTDAGDNWTKLENGLPKTNMGKIGLAISPQKPEVLYAAIELDRRTGGVYKSINRGASWTKMSDAVSGATGPHYYQELVASPHQFDLIYLIDVRIQVSYDGGKTFNRMKEKHKHSDNHALVFRANDPNYMLVGTDGGIYESFDLAESWKFVSNLPVTQYYKLAVDDAEPFYTIYGGTQDNNTQGGPSRTDNLHGISNADWYVTLFADGHQPATEPGNPDIIYNEWQEGNLVRVDKTTGEVMHIQPQAREGEGHERYNWDAPILVSPHKNTRIYFASQRLWKSENRGDSWEPVSGDLTKNQERVKLPIMDKTWGWDAGWDFYAMSTYNTITSVAESPLVEGLIYVGTDDGLIQITEDGGANWKKVSVDDLPGVPKTAFVNNIVADLFDANTFYVLLDNHKFGDLKPYIYKSTNRGKSFTSIKGDIPDRTLLWRLVQDHVQPNLMFLATEFGIYFTVDGGEKWIKMKGGLPTISFRDITIQRRENDVVAASFGRGFFVLDDYTALREVSKAQMEAEATLFPIRDAWWYMPRMVLGRGEKGSQGGAYYMSPNPDFGALITYNLAKDYPSLKKQREKKEAELNKKYEDVEFPSWEALQDEFDEEKTLLWISIKDAQGNAVRRLHAPAKKGINRIAWDLRYPVNLVRNNKPNKKQEGGIMVAPGTYTATLLLQHKGKIKVLSQAEPFEVKQMYKGALKGAEPEATVAFWKAVSDTRAKAVASQSTLKKSKEKMELMKKALIESASYPGSLDEKWSEIHHELADLNTKLNGSTPKQKIGEKDTPTVWDRINAANMGTGQSTYGPTPTHKSMLDIAQKELAIIIDAMNNLVEVKIPELEKEMKAAGAPWIIGQPVEK